MSCNWYNLICWGEEFVGWAVGGVAGGAVQAVAEAVLEGFGQAVGSLGTIWVNIGTPNLTGTGGSSVIEAGDSGPNSGNITTVMNYVMWIALAVAIIALFALGALMATRLRRGEGIAAVGRLGLVLGGVIVIAASASLVSGLMPSGPNGAGGAVQFLQAGLWWYMGAAAIISVIIAGARMAWEQRAEPGRELVRSLLTLIVVAGAGVTIVGLAVAATDSFSVWIINRSLSCDISGDGACFGENMAVLLALTTASGGLGAMIIIVAGLIAIAASFIQIVLMVARGGMLVILTGILPLAASFTNTEMGKGWFKRCVSWLIAFILYKPAAAIVYAAAFQLVGTDVFADDGSGLVAVLTGLMLMIIALFAMPALMRFVTPMVGAMAGGGAGGAMAVGAMAALPTGAAAISNMRSNSGSSQSAAAGASGASGANGSSGAHSSSAGPTGGGNSGMQSAASSSSGQSGQENQSSGAARGQSPSGGSSSSSPGGGSSGGSSPGSSTSAGSSGGGTAAAAGASGASGVAAGVAAAQAASGAAQAASGAAQGAAEQATDDERGA